MGYRKTLKDRQWRFRKPRGAESRQKPLVEPHEPRWLQRLKKGSAYAVAVAVGAALVWAGSVFEGIGKVSDRFKTPDAFVLAENTAKSAFSDQLAQRAWRRLFWAQLFLRRVNGRAAISDIDGAWKSYIDADADWNANIMISIVGLQNYYGKKRSKELEHDIEKLFSKLDDHLGTIRLSDMMSDLRKGSDLKPEQIETFNNEAIRAKLDIDVLQSKLYSLVRCVSDKDHDDEHNICEADDLPRGTWAKFWYHIFNRAAG
jgi:hypothetical protein